MCQQTSAKPLTDPSEPRKVALGDSQERPRAPSGPPSDTRGAPRSRQAENMQTAAEGAPFPAAQPEHLGPVVTPSPPRCKHYFLTLPHRSSRLSVLSLPPPTPDPGGRRIDWAAPTAADPERGSCGQQYENRPLRFLLRVLRRRVHPAANDVEPR